MKRDVTGGAALGTMLGMLFGNSRAGLAILGIAIGLGAYLVFLSWAGVFAARPKPGPRDG